MINEAKEEPSKEFLTVGGTGQATRSKILQSKSWWWIREN